MKDQICYRKIKKHYKYKLYKTYVIQTTILGFNLKTRFIILDSLGLLTIERDYVWDGPSGPSFDTITLRRGSLVHDVLYQLMRMGLLPQKYRKYADSFLKTICIKDKMIKLRAKWIYFFVKKFGGPSAKLIKEKDLKVFYAPK